MQAAMAKKSKLAESEDLESHSGKCRRKDGSIDEVEEERIILLSLLTYSSGQLESKANQEGPS